jgi:steroid delta-isomerase-like uncharacterized protein
MTEAERNLGNRWFEEVWNKQRRDAVAELLTPDAVLHDGATDSTGPEGFYPFFDRMQSAISEMGVTVHDSMVDRDLVCVRWSCTGRHTGDGLSIPSTGKSFHVTGLSMLRVANGKLVEGWQNWDMLGLMQQLQSSPKALATYIGA